MPRPLLVVLAVVLLVVGSSSAAQTVGEIRIGAILSQSGALAATGRAQTRALEAYVARLRSSGGVFGIRVRLLLRDDASDPGRAAELARELIDEAGVHALICCAVPAAGASVARIAEAAQVPTLALASPSRSGAAVSWVFALDHDLLAELSAVAADAQDAGLLPLALMTLDNAFGREVQGALNAALALIDQGLAGEASFPPGSPVLTPEALWLATRQPGAIVVWALRSDTARALDALERRGYRGPVYAPLRTVDPGGGGYTAEALRPVRAVLIPARLGATLPADHPSAAAVAGYRRHLGEVYGTAGPDPAGASAYDAMALLEAALEQALAVGLAPDDRAFGLALRDALIALGPTAGASGIYDFEEDRPVGGLAAGLAIGVYRAGSWRAPF